MTTIIISRFIIIAILLTIVFTAMILIPLIKNPVWWIHDFPQDIQDEYFKTHERIPSAFFSKTVLLKKALGLLIALALLEGIVWWLGAGSFTEAFIVIYSLWSIINWYDCFILDWVFFANIKAVRLPGTEHMDKAYHQKTYHFVRALWGMLIGLIPSLLGSAIYALMVCAGPL